jgi:phospholipase C
MKRGLLVSCLTLAAIGTVPVTVGVAASGAGSDRLSRINHIVVIYQENHSFDNLYGGWEGVNGLGAAPPEKTTQINQNGLPFTCLMQNDPSLKTPPLSETCRDSTTGTTFPSHFANKPFTIDDYITPMSTTCPNGVAGGQPGGCTRDLVHRFYQEVYQLNNGNQNRYVTGADAVGLTMGTYNTQQLPIYAYLHASGHPNYAIADNFFQAAFGGSFLNHQWLIAAATPEWPNAVSNGSADDLHSVVDAYGMPNKYSLYQPVGPVKDGALTSLCSTPGLPSGLLCGNYAVNTIQPTYQPFTPGTALTRRLPPQTAPTIGDRLSAKGIDWAWYSGGWSNAKR